MDKYCIRIVDKVLNDRPIKYHDFEFVGYANSKDVAWNTVDFLITEYRYRVGAVRFMSQPHIRRDLKSGDLLSRHNVVAKSLVGELLVTIGPNVQR